MWISGVATLAALVLVGYGPVWRIARNVVTIAHEGGHAIVALVFGRKLDGIRLHSDTSGVTVSRGRPDGAGMVFTALAGYTAPSLLGLLFAWLLGMGRITLMLWFALLLLIGMLVMIRNVFGVVSVVTTGAVIFAVSWFGSAEIQGAFAAFGAAFLLLAGVRPVFELQRLRARRQAPSSDADQLAHLTGVPGIVWVGVFFTVALASLLLGAWLLLPLEWPLPPTP
ncbi:M50 family metallopeptidase [Actinocorallia sp. A-T 12471]|nr:M50 family metallopeptidase [Actinocorallia sp. A-T 12471]MDX6739402.1 M50 family metallopeptidase [Actinocorallia sp. A-T 12471]